MHLLVSFEHLDKDSTTFYRMHGWTTEERKKLNHSRNECTAAADEVERGFEHVSEIKHTDVRMLNSRRLNKETERYLGINHA